MCVQYGGVCEMGGVSWRIGCVSWDGRVCAMCMVREVSSCTCTVHT